MALHGASGERRLVRCQVFDPAGTFVPEYAQDVVLSAEAACVVPTALSDAAGSYRIRATDVLGGRSAEAAVALE